MKHTTESIDTRLPKLGVGDSVELTLYRPDRDVTVRYLGHITAVPGTDHQALRPVDGVIPVDTTETYTLTPYYGEHSIGDIPRPLEPLAPVVFSPENTYDPNSENTLIAARLLLSRADAEQSSPF